jgi:hypothetical protein
LRLLSKEIWRAFPELDQFDDEVCKRYVQTAKQTRRAWVDRGLISISIPVSFTLWYLFALGVGPLIEGSFPARSGPLRIVEFGLLSLLITGFVYAPWISSLITRDRLLRGAIKRRISSTTCERCNYSLVGLSIVNQYERLHVQCPECGNKTALNEGHITEADINPELLSES